MKKFFIEIAKNKPTNVQRINSFAGISQEFVISFDSAENRRKVFFTEHILKLLVANIFDLGDSHSFLKIIKSSFIIVSIGQLQNFQKLT